MECGSCHDLDQGVPTRSCKPKFIDKIFRNYAKTTYGIYNADSTYPICNNFTYNAPFTAADAVGLAADNRVCPIRLVSHQFPE